MKTNKFMLAAMLFGAVAMVGCKDKNKPNEPDNGGNEPEEPTIEVPVLNTPGAGKTTIAIYVPENTPRGVYLVGSFNDYAIADDTTANFEAVEGEEGWYAVTIDYASNLQVKAIARPSDESVALAWSYQWGMNIDANDPDCKVTEDHVVILQGGDAATNFIYENGGEVKLASLEEDAVIFINIKEWKTTPVIPDVPAATAWMKHPFDGTNWTWKEMTKTADATFTLAARYGKNGCNIAETEGGAENYYETITVEGSEAPAKGDSVLFTFVSTKGNVGTVSMKLIEKGAYVPVPAGNGKFIVTLSDYTPVEGDQIIFTGNFVENGWGASDRVMTAEADGTYSWTGDYPEEFEFKVILVRDGKQNWAKEGNVKFDGENYTATFTFGL